eukprot:gene15967-24431_t
MAPDPPWGCIPITGGCKSGIEEVGVEGDAMLRKAAAQYKREQIMKGRLERWKQLQMTKEAAFEQEKELLHQQGEERQTKHEERAPAVPQPGSVLSLPPRHNIERTPVLSSRFIPLETSGDGLLFIHPNQRDILTWTQEQLREDAKTNGRDIDQELDEKIEGVLQQSPLQPYTDVANQRKMVREWVRHDLIRQEMRLHERRKEQGLPVPPMMFPQFSNEYPDSPGEEPKTPKHLWYYTTQQWYIKDLDKRELQVSMWSGEVVLHDLELVPEALDEFDLPVIIDRGIIGKLKIEIPWKNFYSKTCKPSSVHLDLNHPKTAIDTSISWLDINLKRWQYDAINRTARYLVDFSTLDKFRRYRPKAAVKNAPAAWWQFAFHCILLVQREQRLRTQVSWERLKKRKTHKERYIILYKKTQGLPWLKAPTEAETAEFEELEDQLTADAIIFFRRLAKFQIRVEQNQHKEKAVSETAPSGSWYQWWSGWTAAAPETVEADEIQNAEKVWKLLDADEWSPEQKKMLYEELGVADEGEGEGTTEDAASPARGDEALLYSVGLSLKKDGQLLVNLGLQHPPLIM